MKIQAHYTAWSMKYKFWIGRILQSKACQNSWALLDKIIRAKSNGKKIRSVWIPVNARHLLFMLLVVQELPQRQKNAYSRVKIFNKDANTQKRILNYATFSFAHFIRSVLPVPIVLHDIVVRVLITHTLHNQQNFVHFRAVVVVFML